MRSVVSILFVMLLFSFQGCSKCDNKPLNDVRIRIQNELDVDLESIMIGSTMYKGSDSFASCSMTEGFTDVMDSQITAYTNTYGNHLGYDNVRVQWRDETRDAVKATTASSQVFESELLRNGAVEDSVANVYTGKMMHGLRLPDGDYTFLLKSFLPTSNPVLDIEIIKEP